MWRRPVLCRSRSFRTEVFVYGPVSATLLAATVEVHGERTDVAAGAVDLGRPVAKFTVYLTPGDTRTVTASFQGDGGAYSPLHAHDQHHEGHSRCGRLPVASPKG